MGQTRVPNNRRDIYRRSKCYHKGNRYMIIEVTKNQKVANASVKENLLILSSKHLVRYQPNWEIERKWSTLEILYIHCVFP